MCALSLPDSLSSVKTLLSNNWNTGNVTNGVTPSFWISNEQPMRLSYFDGNGHVLLYLVSHQTIPNDLGASYKELFVDRVSVDIRVKNNRSLLREFYSECKRIVGANVNDPDADWHQVREVSVQDLSKPGFNRYVMDIELKNWVVTKS